MSTASCVLSEDQLLCSICLDVFTDPVSTPCGHNFCKDCITKHWELSLNCNCPNCKTVFNPRPELHVNTFISEMAAQFTQAAQQTASSSHSGQQEAKPGEVSCDVCTGTKLRALKSCLVCLVSYCEAHLERHLKLSGLKRHQLIDPVKNLEGRICAKHDKMLELFCSYDQACVCTICTLLDHKGHKVVPLREVFERKKAELMKTEADLQQQILERQNKIQELYVFLEANRRNADQEIKESVQIFTRMKEAIEQKQAEVVKIIEVYHKRAKDDAAGLIKDLREGMSSLQRRRTELEQLIQSEDQFNLLQTLPSEEAAPSYRSCQRINFCPLQYGIVVSKAVAQLMKELNRSMQGEQEVGKIQLDRFLLFER